MKSRSPKPLSAGTMLKGYLVKMLVSVGEASENWPELITLVERGELITNTRDEIPVADLMPSVERGE